MRNAGFFLLAMLTALLVTACDMAPPVEQVGVANLTNPLVELLEVSTNTKGSPKGSAAEETQKKEFNALLDKFLARKNDVFQSEETDRHLNGIEEMATLTERSFEMINLYREIYDKHGPGHYVGPRLAWAYLNLGHLDQARTVVNASMKARPKDARNFFIHGYLLGRESELDTKVIGRVYDAWQKALELDPKLEHLYGVRADVVRDRLIQMKKLVDAQGKQPAANTTAAPASRPSSTPAQALDIKTLLTRAEVALVGGKAQEAFKDYTKALSADPKNLQAQVGQAVAAWRAIGKEDPARAKALLGKVAEREDLKVEHLVMLGNLYVKDLSDPSRGVALWRRAQVLDPAASIKAKLADRIKQAQNP